MTVTLTRRATLIAAASLLPFPPLRATVPPKADALGAAEARIAALEQQNGGRLGVMATDTEPAPASHTVRMNAFRFAVPSSSLPPPPFSGASMPAARNSTAGLPMVHPTS